MAQVNLLNQNMLWEDRPKQQHLATAQPPLMNNAHAIVQHHNAAQLQARLQSDHICQSNSLQIAHQLHLSQLSVQSASNMADYIGDLRRSQAQAQARAQAHAKYATASSQSLAALGINRPSILPMSVEEQLLLAREQQNMAARIAAAQRQQQAAAMMRGMASVDTSYSRTGYHNIPSHVITSNTQSLANRQPIQGVVVSNMFKSSHKAIGHDSKSPKVMHTPCQRKRF